MRPLSLPHQALYAAAATALLCGCAPLTPVTDSHFGDSVRFAVARQTLRPQGTNITDPVTGIDGRAAVSGYEAYQKSFSEPQPQSNAFTIGVGSGTR